MNRCFQGFFFFTERYMWNNNLKEKNDLFVILDFRIFTPQNFMVEYRIKSKCFSRNYICEFIKEANEDIAKLSKLNFNRCTSNCNKIYGITITLPQCRNITMYLKTVINIINISVISIVSLIFHYCQLFIMYNIYVMLLVHANCCSNTYSLVMFINFTK